MGSVLVAYLNSQTCNQSYFSKYQKMRLLIFSFLVLSLFASFGYCRYACRQEGQKCTPKFGYTDSNFCEARKLISETITTVNTTDVGPNVCKHESLYGRNAYRYYYHCSKSYSQCYCQCKPDYSNCDVFVTKTKTEYDCCDGYTTIPVSQGYNTPHSWYTLKTEGCPIVIQDNVFDCLDELGLTEFQCLLRGSDLEIALQDEDKYFTVFALTNETIVEVDLDRLGDEYLEEALSAHVIDKQLQTLDFKDGQRFETLADQCFVHVTEIGKTYSDWNTYKQESRIFISGSEIDAQNACIAKNGIVHIMKDVVECGNETIADIVVAGAEYSILESLLLLVDKLDFLDNDYPLLTLLAPTNQAFIDARQSLGYNLAACLRNNTDALRKFLHYHIVCGAEYSSTLILRDELKTKACTLKKHYYYQYRYHSYKFFHRKYYYYRECETLEVDINQEFGIEIGEDGVLLTGLDIRASNGVIHDLSLPLLNPTIDFNVLCAAFTGLVVLPPPMAPPP